MTWNFCPAARVMVPGVKEVARRIAVIIGPPGGGVNRGSDGPGDGDAGTVGGTVVLVGEDEPPADVLLPDVVTLPHAVRASVATSTVAASTTAAGVTRIRTKMATSRVRTGCLPVLCAVHIGRRPV
jgi:hypothetical protein